MPPEPRRTGILARSDDNLAGEQREISIQHVSSSVLTHTCIKCRDCQVSLRLIDVN